MGKYKAVEFYECEHCRSVFDSEDMIKIHLEECLLNSEDVHTCVGCKHSVLNLVAPTDKDNRYESLRLQNILGPKAFLTCGKGIYSGKLTQEKILREDKSCFVPKDIDERFDVAYTDGYIRYKKLMEEADEEQQSIDEDILDWHKTVKELKEQGLSEEEAGEFLKRKYEDE